MENKVKNPWVGYSNKLEWHKDLERKWAAENFKILKKIKVLPCKRILDIGASHGFFLKLCEKNGSQVNGIDVDPSVIDGTKIKKCNIERNRFPFEDNTFDIVYSANVLQHIEKPPANLMEEVLRILKPNGKFVLCVRNEKSWINLLISQYDNFRHRSTWTAMSLKQMFEHYKLKVIFLNPKFSGISLLWHMPFKFYIGTNVIIVGQKT